MWVVLSKHNLTPAYQRALEHVRDLCMQAGTLGAGASFATWSWVNLSGECLVQSPVALAMLAAGGLLSGRKLLHAHRTRHLVALSVKCDPEGPAQHFSHNREVYDILLGGKSEVTVDTSEIVVRGPTGPDLVELDSEAALREALALDHLSLPRQFLCYPVEIQVQTIFDRWCMRLLFPLSIFNMHRAAQKMGDSESGDLSAVDIAAYGVGLSNMWRFCTQSSLRAEVAALDAHLEEGATPSEVVARLIDPELLDGPLYCIKVWAANQDHLTVRVNRMGNVVLCQGRRQSYLGPMSATTYPTKASDDLNAGDAKSGVTK